MIANNALVQDLVYQWLLRNYFFAPFLLIFLLSAAQSQLTRRVFSLSQSARAPFSVVRLTSFAHYEYFIVFVASLRGFLSYFSSRLILPLATLFLSSARLDKHVGAQGSEGLDAGYVSYVAMCLAEHHNNNPIVRVFLDVLLRGERRRRMSSSARRDGEGDPNYDNDADGDEGGDHSRQEALLGRSNRHRRTAAAAAASSTSSIKVYPQSSSSSSSIYAPLYAAVCYLLRT